MLVDNEDEDDHLHLNDLFNLIKLVGGEELFHHEALVPGTVSLADHIIIIITRHLFLFCSLIIKMYGVDHYHEDKDVDLW